jgi:hypothetical protein
MNQAIRIISKEFGSDAVLWMSKGSGKRGLPITLKNRIMK